MADEPCAIEAIARVSAERFQILPSQKEIPAKGIQHSIARISPENVHLLDKNKQNDVTIVPTT